MSEKKRKRGDRKDGTLIRDMDAMHAFMPYLLQGRADNEAVMNDEVDLTATLQYLEKKNAGGDDFKYTIFHVVLAALAKTIYLRPAMNRFLQGHRYYQRNDISFAFVVKRVFSDSSEEALVIMKIDQESDVSPIEQIHERVKKEVNAVRKENKTDDSTNVMGILNRFPRLLMRLVARFLFWLDYHGKLPMGLQKIDPYHTTCFVSNLGSIKMSADYHHLINWGTNSFFVLIGEKKWKPVFQKDGSFEMREMLPLGYTVDERIADGFYFARSVKLLRYILRHPEVLDESIDTPVNWEE